MEEQANQLLENPDQILVRKAVFLSQLTCNMKSSIKNMLELAAAASTNAYDAEKVIDCMNALSISGKELLGTVDELEDISLADGNMLELKKEDFNLANQLQYLINILRNEARGRKQRLRIQQVRLVHEEVIGDPQRINKVLWNIISYILKYVNRGEILAVGIQENGFTEDGRAEYGITIQGSRREADSGFLKIIDRIPIILEPPAASLEEVLRLNSALMIIRQMEGDIIQEVFDENSWRIRICFRLRV